MLVKTRSFYLAEFTFHSWRETMLSHFGTMDILHFGKILAQKQME